MMRMRIITNKEWDRLVDLTGGNDAMMHWENMGSWVKDGDTAYGLQDGHQALRGYYSARLWYFDSASNRRVGLGFRPVFENLSAEVLSSDVKDGDLVMVGTLYMGGQPVKAPQEPMWDGDITKYIPGTKLEMREPLEDPAYQVTGIRDGDKVYADRNLLTMISYEDCEKALGEQKKQIPEADQKEPGFHVTVPADEEGKRYLLLKVVEREISAVSCESSHFLAHMAMLRDFEHELGLEPGEANKIFVEGSEDDSMGITPSSAYGEKEGNNYDWKIFEMDQDFNIVPSDEN